ncbi:uncharacterized protein LOC102809850 [Saccoglossus kowalevskii]
MTAIEEESDGHSSDGSSSGDMSQKLRVPIAGGSWSLTTRKSQPLLQINEEEEHDSDEDILIGSPLMRMSSLNSNGSPELLRQKFKQPKLKPANPGRATNYSSSDASDDDTDNRRRCEHDIIRRKHRRGSRDGPPGGGGNNEGSNNQAANHHSVSSSGATSNEKKSASNKTVNNKGTNNKGKKSNEVRDSLKTSNLSVNSNCSSNFSTSKYVIDPSNTTPSDSDEQATENYQNRKISWSKKDFPDISESKMLILPKEEYTQEENFKDEEKTSGKSKIGCTCMCGRFSNNKEINSNSKSSDDSRKSNVHSSQCSLHHGGQTPRMNQSNCCRLI